MRPPVTTIPGVFADWNAIGNSVRAANDPAMKQALILAVQEWEDEGGRVVSLKAPRPKPPARRP